ncbi:MAG: energy transducer TonB [Terriglobales bacterium]
MRPWLFFVVVAAVVTAMSVMPELATAQALDNPPPPPLNFENGVIANGFYSNVCFGLSLPIPSGWEVNAVTASGKAKRRSDKSLVLLFLSQSGNSAGKIILSASLASDQNSSAQNFVSSAVHRQISASADRQLIKDVAGVDFGGQHFYRSDYKGALSDKVPLYFAYIYTRFRGYYIGETIGSASPQGLDEAANSLQAISFQQDQADPNCVMAPDDASASPPMPQRVRVSQGVSQGLLIKKVTPIYPEYARQNRIQGQVILQAEISKSGDIDHLQLITGDPELAPAAMEAVKQWKYKPYLLQGQPVNVETQIIVNFTLLER